MSELQTQFQSSTRRINGAEHSIQFLKKEVELRTLQTNFDQNVKSVQERISTLKQDILQQINQESQVYLSKQLRDVKLQFQAEFSKYVYKEDFKSLMEEKL